MEDDENTDSSRIIQLDPNFTLKKSDNNHCSHKNVIIDESTRQVECSKCGDIISAYDFLVHTAHDEFRMFDRYNMLHEEIPKLEKRYHFLSKQVDRLIELRRKMKNNN